MQDELNVLESLNQLTATSQEHLTSNSRMHNEVGESFGGDTVTDDDNDELEKRTNHEDDLLEEETPQIDIVQLRMAGGHNGGSLGAGIDLPPMAPPPKSTQGLQPRDPQQVKNTSLPF